LFSVNRVETPLVRLLKKAVQQGRSE